MYLKPLISLFFYVIKQILLIAIKFSNKYVSTLIHLFD